MKINVPLPKMRIRHNRILNEDEFFDSFENLCPSEQYMVVRAFRSSGYGTALVANARFMTWLSDNKQQLNDFLVLDGGPNFLGNPLLPMKQLKSQSKGKWYNSWVDLLFR